MKIRKILTALLLSACLAQTATAVPAYPGVIKARQADGTEISIRLRGDEWAHFTTTEDGYPLVFNKQTKNYEYAVAAGNKRVSSNIVAANADRRDAKTLALLNTVDKEAVAKIALSESSATKVKGAKRASGPQKALFNNFPHFGEQHSIVILVEFNDRSFSKMSDAKQYYTDALNKEGFTAPNGANGSARDFFAASSQGQFKPTFDVYGPVKIDYSQYDLGTGLEQGDKCSGKMVQAAIEQLNGQIDFKQYDHDGDGYVDNIYFYYAGYGSADSWYENTIWPHAFDMRKWGIYMKTTDGVGIGSYTCSNEIDGRRPDYPQGIGTFIHEFGHCLGFMDHYDTDNGQATYTPGTWDTMASGSYNNNSNTPPLYNAYECSELGWLQLTDIDKTTEGVNTLKPLSDGYQAYKVSVEGKPNEYFILENRKKTGWDAYLSGEGMLVWHIDYNYDTWLNNKVNTDASHQRIDIVEAGTNLSGDYYNQATVPFPGANNVSSRDFKAWDGNSAIYLDNITKNGDDVEFIIKGSDSGLAAVGDITADETTYKSIKCSWQPADKATEYIVTLQKVLTNSGYEGQLGIVSEYTNVKTTDTNFEFSGLEPETEYVVNVASSIGTFQTKPATKRIATEPLPFEMRKIANMTASDITDNSFTASWDALADAQTYKAYLFKTTFDGEKKATAYGFDNNSTGMPEGWTSSSNSFSSASGTYGTASPSLRMTNNGSSLIVTNGISNISHVKLWMRAQQPGSGSALNIYVQDGKDSWKKVDGISLASGNGEYVEFDVEPTTAVKLQFYRRSSGLLFIDDVEVSGNEPYHTPIVEYNGQEIGDKPSFTFSPLEPATYYTLTVTAVNNGVSSIVSDALQVKTLDATDGIGAVTPETNGKRSFFTIDGKRISSPKGIYVVKENGKATKVAK